MNNKDTLKTNVINHFKDVYSGNCYYVSTIAEYDEKTVLDACNELKTIGVYLQPKYLGNKAWDLIKL